MVSYQLIRSDRRKTLGLQVKLGKVVVRAPNYVSEKVIDDFISQKSAWLRAKIDEQQTVYDEDCCTFRHGCNILFKGDLHTLVIDFSPKPNTYPGTDEQGNKYLVVELANRQKEKARSAQTQALMVKKQLESFYKQHAQNTIPQRLAELSELTSLFPSAYKIRQYKSRWGSCNSSGELSFNYLLLMAPSHIIDYVIIHELCHLKHLNHSTDFWQLVAYYYPEFKMAKYWFKQHQSQLQWLAPR